MISINFFSISQSTDDLIYQKGNTTFVSATMATNSVEKCPWKCELTDSAGYVVYSALGSFYIPMFVMLFFYWRIYRAAIRTTRAINQGFRTTKGESSEKRALSVFCLPFLYMREFLIFPVYCGECG
jgi:hypothetical protein